MIKQSGLILPETCEGVVRELGDELAKMMQFVIPVESAEKELAVITQSIRYSGKVVFLLGVPGVGKSTFIQSLAWRKFLPIPVINEINADELGISGGAKLEELYKKIHQLVYSSRTGEQGLFTIAVNYLEDFAGQTDENIRAFFRDINGLLRRNRVLIIWPTTQKDAIDRVLKLVSAVSSTVFTDNPILTFDGPPLDKFTTIAKTTIATLNPGFSHTDFQLDDEDLDDLLTNLRQSYSNERTIRNYLNLVKEEWTERSGKIEETLGRIPKFTEVWFVVCYPDAESVVSQFARKSSDSDLAWDSDIKKFSEYITTGQRATEWDHKRLLYALQGFFKTKVMFLPTHALVSCVAAYGNEAATKKYRGNVPKTLTDLIHGINNGAKEHWRKKSSANDFVKTTPIAYQIRRESVTFGHRRGKSSSAEEAGNLFRSINQYISSGGEGSDQPINESLALGIRTALRLDENQILVEKAHPWLKNIRPDLIINTNTDKVICVEMHYTMDKRPFVLANYVLDKMSVYMKQLDAYLRSPRMFSDF